jgi:hypothetical protein
MQWYGDRIERRRGLVPGWRQLQRLHGVNHYNLPIHHRHVNCHQLTDEHTLHVCHELPEYHCVDQPDHIRHAYSNNLAIVDTDNNRKLFTEQHAHQHEINDTQYNSNVNGYIDHHVNPDHQPIIHSYHVGELNQNNQPDQHAVVVSDDHSVVVSDEHGHNYAHIDRHVVHDVVTEHDAVHHRHCNGYYDGHIFRHLVSDNQPFQHAVVNTIQLTHIVGNELKDYVRIHNRKYNRHHVQDHDCNYNCNHKSDRNRKHQPVVFAINYRIHKPHKHAHKYWDLYRVVVTHYHADMV